MVELWGWFWALLSGHFPARKVLRWEAVPAVSTTLHTLSASVLSTAICAEPLLSVPKILLHGEKKSVVRGIIHRVHPMHRRVPPDFFLSSTVCIQCIDESTCHTRCCCKLQRRHEPGGGRGCDGDTSAGNVPDEWSYPEPHCREPYPEPHCREHGLKEHGKGFVPKHNVWRK